jgi:hypothetical protein
MRFTNSETLSVYITLCNTCIDQSLNLSALPRKALVNSLITPERHFATFVGFHQRVLRVG